MPHLISISHEQNTREGIRTDSPTNPRAVNVGICGLHSGSTGSRYTPIQSPDVTHVLQMARRKDCQLSDGQDMGDIGDVVRWQLCWGLKPRTLRKHHDLLALADGDEKGAPDTVRLEVETLAQ